MNRFSVNRLPGRINAEDVEAAAQLDTGWINGLGELQYNRPVCRQCHQRQVVVGLIVNQRVLLAPPIFLGPSSAAAYQATIQVQIEEVFFFDHTGVTRVSA